MSAQLIGAHVSTAKGLGNAVRTGHAFGCTAIQVFTSSPRMWKGGPADPAKAKDLSNARNETGIGALVSHDTYLVNLCHPTPETAEKSLSCLRDEMRRCGDYGIPYVVSHMGAMLGQEPDDALKKISDAALEVLKETPESVTLLMETTAGQGSSANAKFEEIARILELTGGPERLCVCLDTCHIFAAGYDIRTPETYEATFAEFDRVVGIDRIKVLHVNDSKKALGSRVDRHDNIGKGLIGIEAFRCLVNDFRFDQVPMILETPTENEGHETDVATLLGLRNA